MLYFCMHDPLHRTQTAVLRLSPCAGTSRKPWLIARAALLAAGNRPAHHHKACSCLHMADKQQARAPEHHLLLASTLLSQHQIFDSGLPGLSLLTPAWPTFACFHDRWHADPR